MKIVGYLGTAGLITMLLSGCSGKEDKSAHERVIPVKVTDVVVASHTTGKHYVGTVEETYTSSLSFQVPGNIEQVFVKEGQRVAKGQLLASLNRHTLQSSYDATLASFVQAQDAATRMQELYANKSLPEMKWVEVRSKLQQAEAMERIAKKNLEDANLYAPFSGVIGRRMAELGENVVPGSPVLTLLEIGDVNIKIAVPEKEIAALGRQQATLSVAALGGETFEGTITEKGITAHPVSHTYEAKIRLENRSGRLLPGMVCDVTVHAADSVPVIILPNNAVQVSHNGERYVWCVRGGKAKAVIVRTGELTANGLMITNGLQEGDQVITEGFQKISEDMKVQAL